MRADNNVIRLYAQSVFVRTTCSLTACGIHQSPSECNPDYQAWRGLKKMRYITFTFICIFDSINDISSAMYQLHDVMSTVYDGHAKESRLIVCGYSGAQLQVTVYAYISGCLALMCVTPKRSVKLHLNEFATCIISYECSSFSVQSSRRIRASYMIILNCSLADYFMRKGKDRDSAEYCLRRKISADVRGFFNTQAYLSTMLLH